MLRNLKHLKYFYKIKAFEKCSQLSKHSSSSCASSSIGLKNVEPKFSGTMREIRLEIRKRLGLKAGFQREPQKRDHLLKYTPTLEELPARSMKDSYVGAIIPLSTSQELQHYYVTPVGTVRLGRLMEQLDMFAVWICHQHVLLPNLPFNEPLPYTFVTILVDKMIFSKLLPDYDQDIRLIGHVSWVGRSSMEISVWLKQKHKDAFRQITHALFLMAARNAINTKGVPVNPLKPSNENEIEIFGKGEERAKTRKRLRETSIFKVIPTEEEHALMYNLFQKTTKHDYFDLNNRVLPKNSRWMSDSISVNTFLAFPENRNAHNAVFGGCIMRFSYEISWMRAYLYFGHRPSCECCYDITFDRSVPLGAIVKMCAHVLYTEDKYIQIMTVGEIFDPIAKSVVITNKFYYTFSSETKVTQILPKSYNETIWYIHGRRILKYALDLKQKHL